MKFSQLAPPAWALFLAQAAAMPFPTTDVDVAIIGGGSAGIHAAIHLRDAGATVAVIEKKHQIGGHAETWTDPRTKVPANAGVVIFENTDIVSKYFTRLKVPFIRSNPISTSGPSRSFDFSLGYPIPAQNASAAAEQQQALQAAVQAYSAVLAKYPWIDQGFLVPDPVPEELSMPFGQLAQKYNFTALMSLHAQFSWFSGDISTIPSLYGLKSFGPGLLNSVLGNFIVSANGDTRALYQAAAKELGDSVFLNATVLQVRRNVNINKSANGVTVLVQQPNQPPRLIRARKLLIAIPPTLGNVGAYDLCGNEKALFSKFSAEGYWTAIASIPGLNTSLTNVGLRTAYNQPVIPGPNGFNAYGSADDFIVSVGFDKPGFTTADAEAVLRKNIAAIAANGGAPKDAAEKMTFPFTSDHSPFNLRVSADEIKAGFYRKFLALEGQRNTYWAGAVFTSQNSGLVWRFNEGTVLPALKKSLGL